MWVKGWWRVVLILVIDQEIREEEAAWARGPAYVKYHKAVEWSPLAADRSAAGDTQRASTPLLTHTHRTTHTHPPSTQRTQRPA